MANYESVTEAFFARLGDEYELQQTFPGIAAVSGLRFVEDGVGERIIDALPGYTDGDTVTTFSRSSSATYKDSTLKLRTAAAETIRQNHYFALGVKGTLLEATSANDWTRSEELNDGAYTKTGATVTQNAIASPDGLSTADKLVEDGSTGNHEATRTNANPTNDKLQAVSFAIKTGERTKAKIILTKKDATELSAVIDLSDGSLSSISAGLEIYAESYLSNWWRVLTQHDTGSGGTTPKLTVRMLGPADAESYTGDSSSGLYLHMFQWEVDKPWPTSYMATAASTASRSSDALSITFSEPAQTLTFYLDMTEIGMKHAQTNSNAVAVEISDGANERLVVDAENGNYRIESTDAASAQVSSTTAVGSIGDAIELLGHVFQAGEVQITKSVNGGADAAGAKSAAQAFPTNWGDPGPLKPGRFDGAETGPLLIRRIALLRGVQPFSEFR